MNDNMPDEIFFNERLAAIYDSFDGNRDDLIAYLNIAKELGVKNILDIGCGTGEFAMLLGHNKFCVTGVDPALASIEIAQFKNDYNYVKFYNSEVSDVEQSGFDAAFMTGNVAQVFLSDEEWNDTLKAVSRRLDNKGYFIFETRNPEMRDWENWTKENTYQKINIPNIGVVEGWCVVNDASEPYIHFTWHYKFENDGQLLTSNSTLRFRSKDDIIESLEQTGFDILDIRDAADRSNKEFVFIAKKAS